MYQLDDFIFTIFINFFENCFHLQVAEFIENNDVAVVGFFKDQESKGAKDFLAAVRDYEEYPVGITSDEEAFKAHDVRYLFYIIQAMPVQKHFKIFHNLNYQYDYKSTNNFNTKVLENVHTKA